jgi:hypothetical protein
MRPNLRVNIYWLRKAASCLAFFGFLTARCLGQLGLPPVISVQPLGVSVQNGGTATFSVTAVSLTSMTFNWRFNGKTAPSAQVSNVVVPLVGTVSTITLSNVSAANAGNYSVKVANAVGTVDSSNALLVVLNTTVSNVLSGVSLLTSQCGMTNGGFRLQMLKPATSNCVIEASTDLGNWTPLYTNTMGSTNISYLDTAATNIVSRYYRARLQ